LSVLCHIVYDGCAQRYTKVAVVVVVVDDCLEDKGKLSVLCHIVYDGCAQRYTCTYR